MCVSPVVWLDGARILWVVIRQFVSWRRAAVEWCRDQRALVKGGGENCVGGAAIWVVWGGVVACFRLFAAAAVAVEVLV